MEKSSIDLISKERSEQINKHNRSIEDDHFNNKKGQLLEAAGILMKDTAWLGTPFEDLDNYNAGYLLTECPSGWDKNIWFKMCAKSRKERLVIAAALIAAHLDAFHYEG